METIYVVIIASLLVASYVASGIVMVHENFHIVTELFGKKWKELGPGIKWIPPLIVRKAHIVFMGTFPYELKLGSDGPGGDVVEFADESSIVAVIIHFKIIKPMKAVYVAASPDELMLMVIDLFDSVIRGFLRGFTVQDADKYKNKFSLEVIAQGVKLAEGEELVPLDETAFGKKLAEWGIKPELISIKDIGLPERIMEQMRRTMQVAKDLEIATSELDVANKVALKAEIVAKSKREVTVIEAKGEKEAMQELAEGETARLKKLMENGLSANDAANHIIELEKTEALKKAGSVTWVGGNTDLASIGAAIGAGLKSK
ncbi:MAG: SPFH domain-containing protein [Bacillota bacterium]